MPAMEFGQIPGISRPVARLVQGTVMLGRDAAADFRLLDAVFTQGGNTFDTARHYGASTEEALGRWVRERGLRDQVVIIGKGAHHSQERRRVTPADITADLDASLQTFGFDDIDLYLLHRDDPSVPVGPIVEILNEHYRAGKIRAFGGSNWSVARLQEANAYAAAHDLQPFVASSPNFSLAVQREPPWAECVSIAGDAAAAERAWYVETGMPVFAWSSLGGGFLSGRVNRENCTSFPGGAGDTLRRSYCTEENLDRLERAERLAHEHGLTVPQVAVAYVLSQPLNLFALVGCVTGEEFAANVAALALDLSPADLAWLETGERPAGVTG